MCTGSAIEAAARDARCGARALAISWLTVVAIMTLALGIGVNAAISIVACCGGPPRQRISVILNS